MKYSVAWAAAGLFAAITTAAPLNLRDLEYLTQTSVVVETKVVDSTVWVNFDGSPTGSVAAQAIGNTPAKATPEATAAPTSAAPAQVTSFSAAPSAQDSSAPDEASWSWVTSTIYSTTTIHRSSATASPSVTSVSFASPSAASAQFTSAAPSPSAAAPAAPTAPAAFSGSKEASTSSGMAAAGTSYTGDITFYATGLGSCGITSGYDDHIVAISHVIMDAYDTGNPNANPLCGKTVNIKYNGQSFPAKVVDRCTGCSEGDLDLSEGFFSSVTNGDTGAGRIGGVSWDWAD